MSGSPVSVSSKRAAFTPGPGDRVLVCGVNWIGDSVMTMPALQAFREAHPEAELTLLVKRGLAPLWRMHPVPDRVWILDEGLAGTWRTASRLRKEGFAAAYVLPHSFRSALIPFLAGISNRIGMPGHARDFMLTRVVHSAESGAQRHQAYEYMDLMAPERAGDPLVPPVLSLSEERSAEAARLAADAPRPRIGLIPGAARGLSKQWPAEYFAELGLRLIKEKGCGAILFGVEREQPLCAGIAERLGANAVNLAGRLDLPTWAAVLKQCDLVVANDSGGMHITAAVNTPLVVLFGITDPGKTGPLGAACSILQKSEQKSRDVKRDSRAARAALESIRPDEVFEAVCEMLTGRRADQ